MKRSLVGLFTLALTAGCTASATSDPTVPQGLGNPAVPVALRLVSYNSCDELLKSVRAAAKQSVGPWGFGGGGDWLASAEDSRAAAPQSASGKGATGPDFSKTNTHEAGVDEPDLVKTDGKRIVIVSGNVLTVIDAASRKTVGTVTLSKMNGARGLLMQGDRALVLGYGNSGFDDPAKNGGDVRIMPYPGFRRQQTAIRLVDLNALKETGDFVIDAGLADARMVGSMVRVVVRNTPTIRFDYKTKPGDELNHAQTEERRLAANQKQIDSAPLSAWLPAYRSNGVKGQVDCGAVSRPQTFSGASVVTVLSFDLGAATLSGGNPVSLMADADTIYGNGPNLYLAHDERWRVWRTFSGKPGTPQKPAHTDLFQFDITGPRPEFVAAGSVQGWLLNQYSMSEHNNVLRVATTTGESMWGSEAKTESTVYTLGRSGGELTQLGKIGGLGKGERIYAVRFVGPTGYVVTFRQTDPLYTVDLRDPRQPKVTGELKITGYSAYLHPINETRLLGVGQEASEEGRRRGTQVSLFDVAGNDPKRLDQYFIPNGHSNAEYDAHAFLYWPATKLLVLPVEVYSSGGSDSGAVLLRVDDGKLTEIGRVDQQQLMRSLVIGDVLWTISPDKAQASTLDGRLLDSVKLTYKY